MTDRYASGDMLDLPADAARLKPPEKSANYLRVS
jgi:hypothetical protein